MAFDVKIVNLLTLGPGIYPSAEDRNILYVVTEGPDGPEGELRYSSMTNPYNTDSVVEMIVHVDGSHICNRISSDGVF